MKTMIRVRVAHDLGRNSGFCHGGAKGFDMIDADGLDP